MCVRWGAGWGGGTKMNGKTMNVNVPSWWVSVGHCRQHDGVNVNVVPSLWVSVGHSVVAANVNVVLSLWVSFGCSRHCGGGEC